MVEVVLRRLDKLTELSDAQLRLARQGAWEDLLAFQESWNQERDALEQAAGGRLDAWLHFAEAQGLGDGPPGALYNRVLAQLQAMSAAADEVESLLHKARAEQRVAMAELRQGRQGLKSYGGMTGYERRPSPRFFDRQS